MSSNPFQAEPQLLSMAMRIANAGAWSWRVSDGKVEWSDENYLLLGLEPRSRPSSYELWLSFIHPEDRERVNRDVVDAVDRGRDLQTDYRIIRPDGAMRWIRDIGKTILDADGRVERMIGFQIDITEQKEAEAARELFDAQLHEQRDELDQLTRTAPIGIAVMDRNLRYVRVNDWLTRSHAQSAEALTGKTVRDVLPADVADRSEAFMQRVIDSGEPALGVELTGRTASTGVSDHHWLLDYYPLLAPDRTVRGVTILVQDITPRREAEEALRESAAALRLARDEQEERVAERTRELAMVNEQLMKEIAERKSVERELRKAHDELEDVVARRTRELAATNERLTGEIAERTLREKQLQREKILLSQSHHVAGVGGWSLDLTTNVMTWTDETYGIFGVSPDSFIPSFEAFIELVHPDDREGTMDAWAKRQAADRPGEKVDSAYRIVRPDGAVRMVDGYSERFAGEFTGVIGTVQDVTERKLLEATLRQAHQTESVGRLAGGIAHDFNNLLTVINGTADLAMGALRDDDPLRADLKEILRAGTSAASLTRQLLAFSRQQVLQPAVVGLSKVVGAFGGVCERLIGEDIVLVIQLVDGKDAEKKDTVRADVGQVEQVLVNLVVNARDAMPQGGTLTISVDVVEVTQHVDEREEVRIPDGSYVRLKVLDTGVGMDEHTRRRVFEPFFTSKPMVGTGLGLATVFGIVKQSEGFIFVDSEVGLGSTFSVYLPQVSERVDAPPEGPTASVSRGAEAGSETVLVVDDDAALLRLAVRMFGSTSYRVLSAASGEEALALLAGHEGPVHLLLTDLVMPGMTGDELARRVKAQRPGITVAYMTGYTDDEVLRRGMVTESVTLLNKPFSIEVLQTTVRHALDNG